MFGGGAGAAGGASCSVDADGSAMEGGVFCWVFQCVPRS